MGGVTLPTADHNALPFLRSRVQAGARYTFTGAHKVVQAWSFLTTCHRVTRSRLSGGLQARLALRRSGPSCRWSSRPPAHSAVRVVGPHIGPYQPGRLLM